MTKQEFDEMVALVVRLRKELEHTNQHLVAHIDALTKSNAQCGEYLRQNEQLHSELVKVRAALAIVSAERDSYRRTVQELEEAETKPQQRIPQVGFIQDDDAYFGVKLSVYGNDKKQTRKPAADIADHMVPPLPLCMKCHGCGCALEDAGAELLCPCPDCDLYGTKDKLSPYLGPCKSQHQVRHE